MNHLATFIQDTWIIFFTKPHMFICDCDLKIENVFDLSIFFPGIFHQWTFLVCYTYTSWKIIFCMFFFLHVLLQFYGVGGELWFHALPK